ncbi:MAG: TVP38/TMEM64 family protein [Planctomycetaceae bacterium]
MRDRRGTRRAWVAGGLSLVMLAAAGFPAWRRTLAPQLELWLANLAGWGTWGPPIVGMLFVPACLLFLPGSWLTLFAGFAFGQTWSGFALTLACVSVGSTLGATCAFLVGRWLFRSTIESWVRDNRRFQRLDAGVRQQGFWIVFLSRLSPLLPFNLLNYAFGVTQVSLRDFVLGSWLGMLPGTVMFLSVGSALGNLAEIWTERRAPSAAQGWLLGLGVLASVWLATWLGRLANQALPELPPPHSVRPDSDPLSRSPVE